MRTILAALVAVFLLSSATPDLWAGPAERMPSVALLHKVDEGPFTMSRLCGPPELIVTTKFYNSFGHESDAGYKAITLTRDNARRPFFVVIFDDEANGDSEATGYVDTNEDGAVDLKERLIVWDDHKRLFCEAHKRLTANRI